MIEELIKSAKEGYNDYVKVFKDKGGKVVGYCCSFLPLGEVYHSAGMLAVRIRGNEVNSTTIGDTYFGAVICSFPKCVLQMAGEGRYRFLDGIVNSTGCDAMRRLDDCWDKAALDYPGIMPPFHYFFGVPHKSLDFNIKWFGDELREHIKAVENHFGVKISDEALRKSIKLYNEARALLRKFAVLRHGEKPLVSGLDAFAVLIAASAMPMEDYIRLLKGYISEIEKKNMPLKGKRLMLTGSIIDNLDLIGTIEKEGAVIVADTLCFGSHFYEFDIEESGDPVEALARGYLNDLKCPRMFGQYSQREAYIKKKIKETKVDGVIMQNIRFCDMHGSENAILERVIEKEGVPCMRIEREYGTLADASRVKMRVDAFLERL